MTEQRHHNRNPKKVMAQEQKKTSKNTNSRRRGSARGRNANGSNSRTPSRKINATRQATAPQQDAVLIAPPKYRKGSMRITPLGGLGEIGRNMNVIEYNGHLLLIDCGVLFPEEEQPGVDLILPDFSYIKNRLDKVDALVLTHGHEDHIGGVPYLLKLRPDIPLIGSKLTLAFVDAKCKEHHQNPTKVEVAGREKLKVGPFDLEFVNVTHSIPDALAVYVKTPAGSLIDTGDIKLDQLPLDHRITDLVEFGKIGEKGVDLLMMDSTNAEVPGFVKPETSIGPALDQAFAQATRKNHRRQLLLPRAPCAAGGGRRPQVRPQGRVRRPFDGAQHVHRRRPRLPAHPRRHRRGPEAGQRHSGRQARLHVHRLPGRTDGRTRPHRRRQPPRYPHQRVRHRDSRQLPDSRQ